MGREYFNFLGEVEISEEKIAKLYLFVRNKLLLNEFIFTSLEKNNDIHKCWYQIETRYESDAFDFMKKLNFFGKIVEFHGTMYDEDTSYTEKFYLENDKFFHVVPEEDGSYDMDASYEKFKREVELKSGEEIQLQTSNIKGVTLTGLLDIVGWVDTKEQFIKKLTEVYDLDVNKQEEVRIEFYAEESNYEMEEETNVSVVIENGEVAFEIDVNRQMYNQKEEMNFNSTQEEYSEKGVGSKGEVLEVLIRPFDFNDFFQTKMYLFEVKKILETEPSIIKVSTVSGWLYPCDVCESRLENQVNGCNSCSFVPVENNPFLDFMR